MRKILFLLLLAYTHDAYTQTLIGKAGGTISFIANEDDSSDKPKFGFTFGAALQIRVNDMLSFQPELNFIQKGAASESSGDWGFGFEDTYKAESKTTLNYLELPLLMRFSFGQKIKFHITAGPSVAMGVGGNSKSKIIYNENGVSREVTEESKIKFGTSPHNNKPFDVAAQLGGGMLVAEKIIIDFRYGYSLTNITDKKYTISGSDSRNRVLQLTIGYALDLSK
jgi:hypothetical protein